MTGRLQKHGRTNLGVGRVLDPFCEFPLRRIIGMSDTGFAPGHEVTYRTRAPGTPTRVERLQFTDGKAFAPWALMNYDWPITAGKPWTPPAWPERATVLKLTAAEQKKYRDRPALNLGLPEVLDLQLQINSQMHARTLPPPLQAASRPIIRILALKVVASEVSTEHFTELWLLSRCELDGSEGWYALSNIVGTGGDVVHGREPFGYPSKTGAGAWQADSSRNVISGARMGREFIRISFPATAVVGQATTPKASLLGLRVSPPCRTMTLTGFAEPGPRADLVAQPWSLELTSAISLEPAQCGLQFPTRPGPGSIGLVHRWLEFGNGKLISAVLGHGAMRRVVRSSPGPLRRSQAVLPRADGWHRGQQPSHGRRPQTHLPGRKLAAASQPH